MKNKWLDTKIFEILTNIYNIILPPYMLAQFNSHSFNKYVISKKIICDISTMQPSIEEGRFFIFLSNKLTTIPIAMYVSDNEITNL